MVFSQQSKQMPFGSSPNSSAYKEIVPKKKKKWYESHVGDSASNVLRKINKPETKSDQLMFQQFWAACLDC